jgi:hypothetical protein
MPAAHPWVIKCISVKVKMSNKVSRRIVISLFVFIPVIYFGLRVFIDIPPMVNPKIDYYKTNTLKKFSSEESSEMWKTYESSIFIEKLCFNKYLKARDKAFLKYCLDNGLGDNIGGGCYHYVGSYNSKDTFNALEYCGIN